MSAEPEPRVMDGGIWEAFTQAVGRMDRLVLGDGVPESPQDRAEGFRYLLRALAAGFILCVEHGDAEHPEFGRMVDHRMAWGLDCPDCLYLYTAVRGDATYRISGNRGSANHFDVQVNAGHFASGNVQDWTVIANVNGDDLVTGPDGELEMILSPTEQGDNWLRNAEGAEFILIRQYFDDWSAECPADLLIERLDAAYPTPPPTTAQIAARYDRLLEWLDRGIDYWEEWSRNWLAMEPNSMSFVVDEVSVGLKGQAYGLGNFYCEPDEAVLLTWEPVACRHFSFSLANWYWESLDFATHQSSLNRSQATVDPDGKLRMVIAHQDPGHANWLDPVGHTKGSLAGRVLLPEAAVEKPTSQVIPLEELAEILPPDTARISAEERAAVLEARRHAVWHRYRR